MQYHLEIEGEQDKDQEDNKEVEVWKEPDLEDNKEPDLEDNKDLK